jgi:two-component system cell cycle sensor histidine kinase/response regulator CckA
MARQQRKGASRRRQGSRVGAGGEEIFRAVVESAPSGMAVVDKTGKIVLVNRETERLFGYAREELVGRSLEMLVPPRFRERHPALQAGFYVTPQARTMGAGRDLYGLRKDGTEIPVEIGLNSIETKDGLFVVASIVNISVRKRSEAELRLYAALVESSEDAIITTDRDGTIKSWNPAAERLYGYTAAEAIGKPIAIIAPTGGGSEFERNTLALKQGAAVGPYEGRRIGRAGRTIDVLVTISPIRDENGQVAGMSGIVRDLTDRKRADAALQESQQRFRDVLDRMQLIGVALDASGRITYCNDFFVQLSGWRRDELIGCDYLSRFIPPEHPVREVFARAIASREIATHYLNEILVRDGGLREVEWNNTLLRDADGQAAGVLSIGEDVTDRRRAERELRRSEADFRSLVEHAPLGIYRVTADGRFLTVNAALIKMLGYESAEDVLRLDVVRDVYAVPGGRAELYAEFAQHDEARTETEWKRKDGRLITVRLNLRAVRGPGGPVACYEGLVEDVTEQRSLEDQFRQAQRMEAVGRLAGGVAHDFNNILTAITGYSDLLLEDLGPEDLKRPDVEEIKAAALRATALTRQLLAFSRKQILQTRVLDLNGVVGTLEKMLQRLLGEDVKLELSLASALGAVRADPGQIEQVIMNLAVNSRDAMPTGGSLTIETANVDLDEAYAREHAGASPGRHVMLAVSDTGIGMDMKTRSQVFEPFFTTKELGKGTGLGLSTVYGIVKQSGGYVWVDSEPGRGATFKIYLPQVDELPEELNLLASVEPVAGGRETVLLAEDDPSVRAVVSDVLTQKGYRVLRAPDGQTALEMARAQPGEIHLLVTDLIMPGMTGRDLAEVLTAERPGIRVLYMSGYTDDAVVRHRVLEEGMPYLQKPFAPRALASKVREVLDRI